VEAARAIAAPRPTLGAWARQPASTVVPWALGSLLIGLLLLGGALLVATVTNAPPEPYLPVFADDTAGMVDVGRVFARNATVLAMQTLTCVAVYLATRPPSTPAQEKAGPFALSVIAGLAVFSLANQIWRLGHDLASAAHTLDLSPAELTVRLTIHAIPELTALFLPLAACIALFRRGRHDDLLPAGLICAAIALPAVFACAVIEVFVTRLVV
jgi:hypothetical protein